MGGGVGSANDNEFPVLDQNAVQYCDKYTDEFYEYRNIILPKEFAQYIPRTHLFTETEWRNLGILQSPGWIHYNIHGPEPHVLMFRRPLKKEASNVDALSSNSNSVKSHVEQDNTSEKSSSIRDAVTSCASMQIQQTESNSMFNAAAGSSQREEDQHGSDMSMDNCSETSEEPDVIEVEFESSPDENECFIVSKNEAIVC